MKRELRQALANENEKVNDKLIDRCIEVGVGAVGTSSPIQLIGVAYNLYKQQFAVCLSLLYYIYINSISLMFQYSTV